jgi:hypothetical protein
VTWTCPQCSSTSYRHITDDIYRCTGCNWDISHLLSESGKLLGTSRPDSESGSGPPSPQPQTAWPARLHLFEEEAA